MSDNNGLKGSLAGEPRNNSNEVKVSTNERYKFDFGTPEELRNLNRILCSQIIQRTQQQSSCGRR